MLRELLERLEDPYSQMIEQIQKLKRQNPKLCQLVLSTITLAYQPLHLTELATISRLPAEISGHASHIREVIALCRSFLTVKDSMVYLIHQSVKDYLSDRARHTIFPSGPGQVYRAIFARSVEAMLAGTLRRDMYNLQHPSTMMNAVKVPTPDPVADARYSCIHWARHFFDVSPSRRSETGDLDLIDRFFRTVFLYWLEAASLLGSISEVIISIRRLEACLKAQSCEGRLMNLVSDAVRFTLHNRPTIETAPLQTYISALIFSPPASPIRKEFGHEEPTWVNPKPIIEPGWGPCLQTLHGHCNNIQAVLFSPDGRRLVSGSSDGTIKVWDRDSGACMQTLHHDVDSRSGLGYGVMSVASSSDGQKLVSISNRSTIVVWDLVLGTRIQTLEVSGTRAKSVAFSLDDRQIYSISHDGAMKVWDMYSGICIQSLESTIIHDHSIVFSPDSRKLAVTIYEDTIELRDRETGTWIRELKESHQSVITMAFSPNSQHLISGCEDGAITVWDLASGTCMRMLESHNNLVMSVIAA